MRDGAPVFCRTDLRSVATIDFVVTRQPGDNFAIAAGVTPAEVNAVNINGIELTNGSGQNIPTNCPTESVCRSQMLTVWRRLHIEVDSMGESQQNFVSGNFAQSARVGSFETDVQVNTSQPLEVNRFENGRLVSGSRSLRIISNTADTVRVRVFLGGIVTITESETFQLYDDDDFNDDDGPPPGDGTLDGDTETDEDITEPDTALLTANSNDPNSNAFATAYVRPVYDVVDPRDNGIFQANVDGDAATDIRPLFVAWDSSSTNREAEFWSIYLLGSYQHVLGEDNDSTTEPCPGNPGFHCVTFGIVDEITNVTGPPGDMEGSGALIFMELHRPRERPGYNPAPTSLNSMAVTVAHEVGHLFSCIHGDGGLMGTDPMTGTPVTNQLSPRMIFKIRGLMHP